MNLQNLIDYFCHVFSVLKKSENKTLSFLLFSQLNRSDLKGLILLSSRKNEILKIISREVIEKLVPSE